MEKIKGQIYIHMNKITGKHYVGQTIANPVEARWCKGGDSYNKTTKFGRAIKKYGWESFEHAILPEIYESHKDLDKAEIAKIAELDSYKNGYNSTLGGNGSSGYVKSDESKKKISEALKGKSTWIKGKKMSEESRAKMSNSHKGKVMSEETKEKMRQANKGKIPWNKGKKGLQSQTEETREKIRQARLGTSRSEETKTRLSNALKGKTSWNKGRTTPDHVKEKISKSLINKN